MTVETASFISQLNTTLPTSSDPKSEGDNQLRLIKSVLQTQFPNFGTAAMTASHTELNYMVGVTSAVQTQLNAKGAIAGQAWTGTHNFTGATVTVPTASPGDNSTKAASTAFATALAFSAALPSQTGNAGKVITTDGSNASWTDSLNGNFGLTGVGRRFTGPMGAFNRSERFMFTDSDPAGGYPTLGVVPRVSGSIGASFEAYADPDPDNSQLVRLFANKFANKSGLDSGRSGTGVTQPLVLQINGDDALQIDTSKNIRSVGGGAIGYGPGSGGTVTQLTSKSTTVTLNKPCGQITMNNAALAAGASVNFTLLNTFITPTDGVIISIAGGIGVAGLYRLTWYTGNAGSVIITLTNQHSASLGEPVVLSFQVIKGATS